MEKEKTAEQNDELLDSISQLMKNKKEYSFEEELLLLRKAKAGDRDAVSEIINMHLPLIHLKCLPYIGQGVELPDLMQEAILYIVKSAIPAFNPEKGYRFSAFIQGPITWSCLGTIASCSKPITFSYEIMNRLQFLSQILDDPTLDFPDVEARIEHVARCEGVSVETVVKLLPFVNGFGRLMSKTKEDGVGLGEYLKDDVPTPLECLEDGWLREQISLMIENLSPKEQEAVNYRFEQGFELEEIGEILNISKQAVHSRISNALRKLRPWLEELPGFMAYDLEPSEP